MFTPSTATVLPLPRFDVVLASGGELSFGCARYL